MGALTSPFARLKASMGPLAPPAPEPADISPYGMGQEPIPAFPSSSAPKVNLAKFDPETATPEDLATHPLVSRLRSDESKDLHPWGTPENHPGFFGKLGHALSVATGAPNRRMYEEMGLQKSLQDLLSKQAQAGLETAETGAVPSEISLRGAQTENLEHPNLSPLSTATGYESYNPKTGTAAPIEEGGKPLMPYVKPGPLQKVTLMGPDGKPMLGFTREGTTWDSEGNLVEKPMPFVKPSAPQHITVMHDGQPHVMGADAEGNFTRDLGVAPPNYGQMVLPTKTATFIGDNGMPVEYQWNEQTQTYDKPLGLSASNAYGHEAAQAGAVSRDAQSLIQDIQANRDKLGNTEAIVKSALLGTPWADPATARLRSRIATFAALQPSMHGFRGSDALKQFEKIIGGIPNNPDALIAAIQGINQTAGAINPALQNGGGKTEQKLGQPLGETTKSDGVYEIGGKKYRAKGGKVYAY